MIQTMGRSEFYQVFSIATARNNVPKIASSTLQVELARGWLG